MKHLAIILFFGLLFSLRGQVTHENFENVTPGPITGTNQIGGYWYTFSGFTGSLTAGSNTNFPNGVNGQSFCNLLGCCPMTPVNCEIIDCSSGYTDPVIGSQYPVYSVFGTSTVQGAVQANPHMYEGMKGSRVMRLNGSQNNDYSMAKLSVTFSVTAGDALLQFAFLPVFFMGHGCCDAGGFRVRLFDNGPAANGTPTTLTCYEYSLAASPSLCTKFQQPEYYKIRTNNKSVPQANDTLYARWSPVAWDLSAYIGHFLTLEFMVGDCNFGDHFSYVYLDCDRKAFTLNLNGNAFNAVAPTVSVTSCGAAQLCAKNGMGPSSWTGPGIPQSYATPSFTNSCITTTVSGNYTLTMYPEGACAPVIRVINGTIHPGLYLTPPPEVFDLCQTSFVDIYPLIQGTVSGSSFTWTGPSTASIVSASGATAQVNAAGVYTVVTSNTSNLCTSSTQVTVGICVGLSEALSEGDFRIYPNPTTGIFRLDSDRGLKRTKIEVYTMFGKCILQGEYEGKEMDLNILGQPPGVYSLRLESGSKTTFYKIVKE